MRLFCIGNGFDIHHGLKSKYKDFKLYLKENDFSLYEKLMVMYSFPDSDLIKQRHSPFIIGEYINEYDNFFWSDFENNLSVINTSFFEDTLSLNEAKLDGVENSDEEWRGEILYKSVDLYNKLQTAFNSWVKNLEKDINKVDTKKRTHYIFDFSSKNNIFNLNCEDFFIIFNYTHIIEEIYGIPRNNIIYPHGECGREFEVYPIFGHGDKTMIQKYKEKMINAKGDERVIYSWVIKYLYETMKDVRSIIKVVKSFLNNIPRVDTIVVFGMSFGDVDTPYFDMLNAKYPNVKWKVTYYNFTDYKRAKRKLSEIGVKKSKIKLINLKKRLFF